MISHARPGGPRIQPRIRSRDLCEVRGQKWTGHFVATNPSQWASFPAAPETLYLRPADLEQDVTTSAEVLDDFIKMLLKHCHRVPTSTEPQVHTDQVPLAASAELGIIRDQYGLLLIGVDGERVVLLQAQPCLVCAPALMTMGTQHAADTGVDVLVEEEAQGRGASCTDRLLGLPHCFYVLNP